jgi:beta-N-acetylhexosaminidase
MVAAPYDVSQTSQASQSAYLSMVSQHKPGFIVLFGERIPMSTASEVITSIANEVTEDERPLIAVDHEGGRVQRLNGAGFTLLPTWRRVCNQTAEQRTALLATSAAELKQTGVDIVFAPVVDVAANNPVLSDRACSGDAELVGAAASDFAAAFSAQGILPVIKHYPGSGSATVDTHRKPASVLITERDVFPFKFVLDTYPQIGVMTAHAAVENQSADIACSLSPACVRQLFDLYPDVVVFTDALEMEAARFNSAAPAQPKALEAVAIEAIMAGNNVLVFGNGVPPAEIDRVMDRIRLEYANSATFRELVNASIEKIEKLRKQQGIPER